MVRVGDRARLRDRLRLRLRLRAGFRFGLEAVRVTNLGVGRVAVVVGVVPG